MQTSGPDLPCPHPIPTTRSFTCALSTLVASRFSLLTTIKEENMSRGLGYRQAPDLRDGAHLVPSHLQLLDLVLPDYRQHEIGDTLDQLNQGSCVGHGWTHWENCKPKGHAVQQQHPYAVAWYERAKEVDEWWGTDYEGTSVRAGAKV